MKCGENGLESIIHVLQVAWGEHFNNIGPKATLIKSTWSSTCISSPMLENDGGALWTKTGGTSLILKHPATIFKC